MTLDFRTIFLSDVHLGMRGVRVDELRGCAHEARFRVHRARCDEARGFAPRVCVRGFGRLGLAEHEEATLERLALTFGLASERDRVAEALPEAIEEEVVREVEAFGEGGAHGAARIPKDTAPVQMRRAALRAMLAR